MAKDRNPFEDQKRPWIEINGPLFPPLPPAPPTTSILAFGVLGGVLLFTPMVALIGDRVPPEFRPDVTENLKLMRDAMLLVLGYYFSKVVNAGENSMAVRAIQAAREATPSGPAPPDAQAAAEMVADAATAAADGVIGSTEDTTTQGRHR